MCHCRWSEISTDLRTLQCLGPVVAIISHQGGPVRLDYYLVVSLRHPVSAYYVSVHHSLSSLPPAPLVSDFVVLANLSVVVPLLGLCRPQVYGSRLSFSFYIIIRLDLFIVSLFVF